MADEDILQGVYERDCLVASLRSRIAELEARLEIDHHFEYIDGEMVRVEIAPEARQIGDCDGIGCRDATIALQDDVIDRASYRIAVLETALEPFAEAANSPALRMDFTIPRVAVLHYHCERARSVLSEGNSDSKPILDAKGGSRTGEGELEATSGDHDANEAS